ncbi:hypothetical protein E4H12_09520 [Candidatus Thorarchaeota archaeon]|nr:MAG: hypothetical protein E4H12_09520 [Candidatus Thorarchaeota archaeon]
MIIGEIRIDTTFNASTSFVSFPPGFQNAQDYAYEGVANRGIYATTAWVEGVWERQVWEEGYIAEMAANPEKWAADHTFDDKYGVNKQCRGLAWRGQGDVGNAFDPGTVIQVKVRKIKALRASPNKSGIQINRRLVKGNKLVFRYVAQGELTRPM